MQILDVMFYNDTVTAEIFQDAGGSGFQWASDLSERNKLWKARHNCLYAAMALRPGTRVCLSNFYFVLSSRQTLCNQETSEQMTLCK